MRTRVTWWAGAVFAAAAWIGGCGDSTGPGEEDPPEEYAFVLSAGEGVIYGGEVAAYALVDLDLLEVRALLLGTADGTDDEWHATDMVREALEGGTLEPPNGVSVRRVAHGPPIAAAPVVVTVGDRTARVVGMEFTFLYKLGGPGTVTLRGTVNGETEVSGSITGETGSIGKLVLGSVPGG